MQSQILATFYHPQEARRAVETLLKLGAPARQISLLIQAGGDAVEPIPGLAWLEIPRFGVLLGGGPLSMAVSTAVGPAGSDLAQVLLDHGWSTASQECARAGGALLAVGAPCGRLFAGEITALLRKHGVNQVDNVEVAMAG